MYFQGHTTCIAKVKRHCYKYSRRVKNEKHPTPEKIEAIRDTLKNFRVIQ